MADEAGASESHAVVVATCAWLLPLHGLLVYYVMRGLDLKPVGMGAAGLLILSGMALQGEWLPVQVRAPVALWPLAPPARCSVHAHPLCCSSPPACGRRAMVRTLQDWP